MDIAQQIYNLLKEKNYEEAAVLSKEMDKEGQLEGDPVKVVRAKVYLAIVYTRQHQYEKSKGIFDDHFNDIVDLLVLKWNGKELVQTYMAYSQLDRSLYYLDKYLIYDEHNAEANYLKATIFFKQEKFEETKTILDEVLKRYPNHPEVLFTQALVYEQLKEAQQSFHYFEKALGAGNQASLMQIIQQLFNRDGVCEYKTCPNSCCKKIMLKGTDGRNIKNDKDLKRLIIHDSRNSCWQKHTESSDGKWIFMCKHNLPDNGCDNYEGRPQTCRDYPANLLVKRQGCSYQFTLKESAPKFSDVSILSAVLDVLDKGGYSVACDELIKNNIELIESSPDVS